MEPKLSIPLGDFGNIVFFRDHRFVIAYTSNSQGHFNIGTAMCTPEDTFNLLTGCTIALDRLMKNMGLRWSIRTDIWNIFYTEFHNAYPNLPLW